jgi:putative endonuclease
MFYIYILYSSKHDKYYVGYTSNPALRILQHNEQMKFNTFTAKYRPWEFAAIFEIGEDEKLAIKMERFIKKQKSRTFIEKLIKPSTILTDSLAQLVRVPKLRD